MGAGNSNAERLDPEVIFRCHTAAQAEELRLSLSKIFPKLSIDWHNSSFDLTASQGIDQSFHDYLHDRRQIRRWLANLPDSYANLPKLLYKSALLTLDLMEKQTIKLEPEQAQSFSEKIQAHEVLMEQLVQLGNYDALLVICKDINLLGEALNKALHA